MTNEPVEKPTAFHPIEKSLGRNEKGLHATFCYLHPMGEQRISTVWFAPVIAYDEVILWQGEPQETANEAQDEAKKYLSLKLKDFLNPLSSSGGAKQLRAQPQLF